MVRISETMRYIAELSAEMSLSPTLNDLYNLSTELAEIPREEWRDYALSRLIPEQVR